MSVDVSWGRYQAGTSVLMALLKMPAAWFQLSLLYLAPEINHRCSHGLNQSLSQLNTSASWDGSCSYQDVGGAHQPCQHFQYSSLYFSHTVNMQWGLVCERSALVTVAQMALMVGVTTGNLAGGLLADRVGRKPVLVAGLLLQPLVSGLVAIVPTFPLFLLFRYLSGIALGYTMVISFVLGAELVNDQWRPVISILHQVPFGMGQTLLALLAYFLRDWRELQLAISACCLVFLPYCWLVEESPKWLKASGRLERAQQVTNAICRRNGLSPATVAETHPMTEKLQTMVVKTENGKLVNNVRTVKDSKIGFSTLFRTPRLRHYTLSVWLMWFCAGLSFFALNAYQPALGSSPFLNIGLGGLLGAIPGNILTIFLVRRFGRKRVVIVAHIFVSIFAIHIPTVDVGESPEDWQRRLLALLSFIAMSIAYPALFLLSAELTPAVLRGSVLGVANLMARLGNTTAPLVGPTGAYSKWLPLIIIAVAPLITSALMLSLPDTGDKPLPITVQDIESPDGLPDIDDDKGSKEENKIYKPVAETEHDK